MEEAVIFIFDAKAGMKLSADVFSQEGNLLVKKDTVLDWKSISDISSHQVLEIKIYDENASTNSDVPKVEESEESIQYFDKIRQSEDFKVFEEKFEKSVDVLKEEFKSIVEDHKEIDTNKILNSPMDIINSSSNSNSFRLLDMIHSMRKYDDLTYVHSLNVALIASVLGRWLGIKDEDEKNLFVAGMLHDIGKVKIPKEILTKPGKLTDNEYSIMKKHVNLGYEILRDQNIIQEAKEACLLHHERYDGTGYPFGLVGNKIPYVARVMAVADVYDAMTANRVYRKAICPFQVVEMMHADTFSKYDPAIALSFLKNIVSSYINNDIRLSDGRVGRVVIINENALSRPTVMIGDELVDMVKHPEIEITAIIN
jgi:putative nucleotidyltransferase with HDIG domain